jgi:hypothetical protein
LRSDHEQANEGFDEVPGDEVVEPVRRTAEAEEAELLGEIDGHGFSFLGAQSAS